MAVTSALFVAVAAFALTPMVVAPVALASSAPKALPSSARSAEVGLSATNVPGSHSIDSISIDSTDRVVRALIVQYRPGVSPRLADGSLRGAHRVTGPLAATLRLGSGLGLNMWRVDFTRPVPVVQARRVAQQLESDPSIVSAEPDTPVAAFRAS